MRITFVGINSVMIIIIMIVYKEQWNGNNDNYDDTHRYKPAMIE